MQCLLVSTYELGRQPFGLASAAAWLQEAGASADCIDIAVEALDPAKVAAADLVAFYVPMHTATRIAIAQLPRIKAIKPGAHICFFGLYAPVNETYLRKLGIGTVLGGEFEEGLRSLAIRLIRHEPLRDQTEPVVSLARQEFLVPDRRKLPQVARYAKVVMGDGRQRTIGYTEASRGCRHLCRHCPIVPVYGGRFRVVQRGVVLADIRAQIGQGAQHITFGDPDFFNGPAHGLAIVEAMHAEFPGVSYDVTIKIEHLRRRADLLPRLRDTGCLFVTSAVEAVDDRSLEAYEKNHTRQDFIDVAGEFRRIGLVLNPTFVTFSPWTTLESYADLLRLLAELDLVDHVSPIQFAIRLLIPSGSRLLELSEIQELIGDFDEHALCYRWSHPDPRVDRLFEAVRACVESATARGAGRREVFGEIWSLTRDALSGSPAFDAMPDTWRAATPPQGVPSVTEPWYCCAEPTEEQLRGKNAAPV